MKYLQSQAVTSDYILISVLLVLIPGDCVDH